MIGQTSDLVAKLESQTNELPWSNLIRQRVTDYDAAMEPVLKQLRIEAFYTASRQPTFAA